MTKTTRLFCQRHLNKYRIDAITLELRDNGIGMTLTGQDREPDTLGLRLIKGLCEDIDADVDNTIDNGTRITIVFMPDVLNDGESFLKSQDKTNRSV